MRLAPLIAVLALAACDGKYVHARCMNLATEPACRSCCVDEGFSDEIELDPNDALSKPDCYCFEGEPQDDQPTGG